MTVTRLNTPNVIRPTRTTPFLSLFVYVTDISKIPDVTSVKSRFKFVKERFGGNLMLSEPISSFL